MPELRSDRGLARARAVARRGLASLVLPALCLACPAEAPRDVGAPAGVVEVARARPQTPAPPFPYLVEELEEHEALGLRATLTIPEGPGPHPVAILISGTGIQDRDGTIAGHRPAWVLADHLARAGVATLRYDDRGYASLAAAADEVWAARAVLLERASIDRGRLGLIGHSEGGVIASLVASEHPDDVAFIVLLAARGATGSEVVVRQLGAALAASGLDPAIVEAEQAAARRVHEAVLARAPHEDRAEVEALLRAAHDRFAGFDAGVREQAAEVWIERQLETLDSPWFREFLGWDPAPTLARVRAPVLVIHGGRDTQVDATQNVAPMRAALAANPGAEILVFAELNHLLQPATTGAIDEYEAIEVSLDPRVLDAIATWIDATPRARGP